MAADRAKTTLMIALIISVMIAFILAVTTYLGFQQRNVQQTDADKSRADARKANEDLAAARRGFETVRDVLGIDKDTPDAIEAERNQIFDTKFSGFDAGQDKTFLNLVDWLNESIKAKNDDIKRLEADKAQIRKEQEAAEAAAAARAQAAEQARDQAVAEQARQKDDFDKRWAEHEQALRTLKQQQEAALAKADRLEAIATEIDKLGPLLGPDLRRRFEAKPQEDQPDPWPERVRLVSQELRNREKAVKDLNATLAQLRVADPELQKLVREATPEDDRIDGFDGRVASINSRDRTLLVLCDSTAGMRPGLLLWVYDPDDPRPRLGARKALVEVVDVEGPTMARARIRTDSATTPILAGDGVATSLWAPGAAQEIAVVGYVRVGPDRQQGQAALEALVERNGGRLVDTVTPQTAFVVDGGLPQPSDLQKGKTWKPADEALRRNALARAKELGLRVVSLDGLLDMLGLDREALVGSRLSAAP